ncbi:MAG: peroxide stress protein YaaA, partial [Draconibacterium sp.]|nr:peroxide stress protein YaaA [Draconibacterium sp.]
MLIVISPAKLLDFETKPTTQSFSIPEMLSESEKLIISLQKMSPKQISKLMGISDNLGELNFQRFQNWNLPFTPENAKQAVLAFNGEVFRGLNATTLSEEQLQLSQTKLRILSGLYGVLKPLDLIQPYRLEMGTKMKYRNSPNLYAFWQSLIVEKINEAVAGLGSGVLVNLASNEYFKSIDKRKLNAEIVTPEFKELKNGNYKTITVYAKKA